MSDETYPVKGMHCGSCAVLIEEALKEQPGVSSASVNRAAGTVTIAFDAALTDKRALAHAVAKEGFQLVVA